MNRPSRLGLGALALVILVSHSGCSLVFRASERVDNDNFVGCFQRNVNNPDGTREATRLTLSAGQKPVVSGTFSVTRRDADQNRISREDYALAGKATSETKAKLTAAPTMGTAGSEQEIRISLNLGLDSAQIDMSEADGRSFSAMLRCPGESQ